MYLMTFFLKWHMYLADNDWCGGTCLAIKGRSSFEGMVGFIWWSEITYFMESRFKIGTQDPAGANQKLDVLRGHI